MESIYVLMNQFQVLELAYVKIRHLVQFMMCYLEKRRRRMDLYGNMLNKTKKFSEQIEIEYF